MTSCSICKRPVTAEYRPFCSLRCANVDLHRWLNDTYVIPGRPDENAEPDDADDHSLFTLDTPGKLT